MPASEADGRRVAAALAAAIWLAAGSWNAARAQEIPDTVARDALRVCADPANTPFSNRKKEGFENKIAEIVADELNVPVRYYWLSQGPGFVRNTLGTKLCDIIMGYASGAEPVQSTNPYYESVYTLIIKPGGDLDGVERLEDPRLKGKKLGVVAATPPADHLVAAGLIADSKPYSLLVDRSYESPAEEMIADLVAGRIDAAILWGPLGGYFAKKAGVPLKVVPLIHETERPAMAYRIAFGIRHNENDWKHRLNQIIRKRQKDIDAVLLSYGVPLLDRNNRLIQAAGAASPEPPKP